MLMDELTNSDLRAVANSRATRKFFSRSVRLLMVFTGILAALPNIWYTMGYLPCMWLVIWFGMYMYVTSKVSGKIYRKLLELRSIE